MYKPPTKRMKPTVSRPRSGAVATRKPFDCSVQGKDLDFSRCRDKCMDYRYTFEQCTKECQRCDKDTNQVNNNTNNQANTNTNNQANNNQ